MLPEGEQYVDRQRDRTDGQTDRYTKWSRARGRVSKNWKYFFFLEKTKFWTLILFACKCQKFSWGEKQTWNIWDFQKRRKWKFAKKSFLFERILQKFDESFLLLNLEDTCSSKKDNLDNWRCPLKTHYKMRWAIMWLVFFFFWSRNGKVLFNLKNIKTSDHLGKSQRELFWKTIFYKMRKSKQISNEFFFLENYQFKIEVPKPFNCVSLCLFSYHSIWLTNNFRRK